MNNSLLFRCLVTALLVCATSAAYAQDEPATPDTTEPATSADADTSSEDAEDTDTNADSDQEESSADEESGSDEEPGTDTSNGSVEADGAETDGTGTPDDATQNPTVAEPAVSDDTPEPGTNPTSTDPGELSADDSTAEPQEAIIAPPEKTSPIADLAGDSDNQDFVPLEDLDEGVLQSITPAEVYPFVDWSGSFRLQQTLNNNFDLDTRGTSAVAPPVEQFTPANDQTSTPVDAEADTHWSTNMRLRLEPELNITESLRVHIEADLLDNVVLGTQQGDADSYGVAGIDSSQSMIKVNEAWAEIDVLSATLRAGRTDDQWGLGIFANDGDCLTCRVEAPIDRISLTIPAFGFYGRLTADFPAEGLATAPLTFAGQSYDAGQIDDADQYTLSIFHKARTRKDRELRSHRLYVEKKPVFNGGIYFTYRSQDGFFRPDPTSSTVDTGELERLDQGTLTYRGMQMYIPDVWFEVVHNPEPDMLLRVSLEAIGIFGSIENASDGQVGVSDDNEAVNCFDEDTFAANESLCTTEGSGADRKDVSSSLSEFGVALESELYLGGPVRFGLNGGFATGGSERNWGFESDASGHITSSGRAAMQFYRFNPNYQVDLILFREVIGTVTNAYYANPWAQARFWESASSRMEVQLDAIFSGAVNPAGTPSAVVIDDASSGGNSLLGLEFDAAARYIESDQFQAELAGGILFPFAGLEPQLDSERLVPYGDQPQQYGQSFSPTFAWTIQANLNWMF